MSIIARRNNANWANVICNMSCKVSRCLNRVRFSYRNINIPASAEALIQFVTKQLIVAKENEERHHFYQQHTSRTQEQEVASHYGE